MPSLSHPDWHFQEHEEFYNSLVQQKKKMLEQHKHKKRKPNENLNITRNKVCQWFLFDSNKNLRHEYNDISMVFSELETPPSS